MYAESYKVQPVYPKNGIGLIYLPLRHGTRQPAFPGHVALVIGKV